MPKTNLFEFHKLNELGQARAKIIAGEFDVLLERLDELMPSSRTRSLCETKLEEACFYAKKSMALDPRNQQDNG